MRIFSDSYGRGVASLIKNTKCSNFFDVSSTIKPSALMRDVTDGVQGECTSLVSNDFVVIMAGANDVAKNETLNAMEALQDTLPLLNNTNVIVVNIPHRHDLLASSCVNKEVVRANIKIREICEHHANITLVNSETCGRALHTRHGHHFNNRGKRVLANVIWKIICDKAKSKRAPMTAATDTLENESQCNVLPSNSSPTINGDSLVSSEPLFEGVVENRGFPGTSTEGTAVDESILEYLPVNTEPTSEVSAELRASVPLKDDCVIPSDPLSSTSGAPEEVTLVNSLPLPPCQSIVKCVSDSFLGTTK